jgi:Pyruvate/2-oxoacid:ferredoxin oxidoreductase delta subunit
MLPEIEANWCVHSRIENASCRACVNICPQHAWQLNDDGLGLDIESCDGCGLCVPICPETAIRHNYKALLRQRGVFHWAFLACDQVGLNEESNGLIPCAHALGLRDLLELYQQGMQALFIAVGNCEECFRGGGGFFEEIMALNNALENRQLPHILLKSLDAENWLKQSSYQEMHLLPKVGFNTSRRNFFKQGLQQSVQTVGQGIGFLEENIEKVPPPIATLLPDQTGILPFVPIFHFQQCIGCDTCLKLCPHQAIELDDNKYLIHPKQCTGCMICTDVCNDNAIEIETWMLPQITEILLDKRCCKRCGAPFHRPKIEQPVAELCPICSQVNHHQHLFQVLK